MSTEEDKKNKPVRLIAVKPSNEKERIISSVKKKPQITVTSEPPKGQQDTSKDTKVSSKSNDSDRSEG